MAVLERRGMVGSEPQEHRAPPRRMAKRRDRFTATPLDALDGQILPPGMKRSRNPRAGRLVFNNDHLRRVGLGLTCGLSYSPLWRKYATLISNDRIGPVEAFRTEL